MENTVSANKGMRNENHKIVEDLNDTAWYLYYHEYEENEKPAPFSIVSRLLLYISNLENITLYEKRVEGDFKGRGRLENGPSGSVLVINLERDTPPHKDLQLRITGITGISDDSLLLGQYIDFELGDSIISRTFVLENARHAKVWQPAEKSKDQRDGEIRSVTIQGKTENFAITRKELTYDSNWKDAIHPTIAKYLAHKWMNFTKTRSGVQSVSSLAAFLEKQDQKTVRDYKFNSIIEYDFFVIGCVPKGGINSVNRSFFKQPVSESRESNAEERFETVDSLKKLGIRRMYFSPRIPKSISPSDHFSAEQKAMRQSRFVMLISNGKLSPFALVAMGWAMQMEKDIFVFPTQHSVLPDVLSNGRKDLLVVSGPTPIERIPSLLGRCKQRLYPPDVL
jgi:hypothetical protein